MEGFFLDIVKGQVEATEKDSGNYFWHSFWLLIRKSDRVIVGSADFKDIPNKDCEVEIGYGLGKDFEHNGYMTEALLRIKHFAFNELKVNRFQGGCAIENIASRKVMEKCGMHFEGTLKKYLKLKDGYHDMHMFSITN